MKRMLFALPLLLVTLVSGCIVPVHDRGYHRGHYDHHDRDHHHDRDRHGDHDHWH